MNQRKGIATLVASVVLFAGVVWLAAVASGGLGNGAGTGRRADTHAAAPLPVGRHGR